MAQPKCFGAMEREAVYRIREMSEGGREISFAAKEGGEREFLLGLAEAALYPEKPLVSFETEREEEGRKKEEEDFVRLVQKLKGKQNVQRLITCGGVDDGKSTLIGRILYDTKSREEQERIQRDPACLRKDKSVDYALLAGMTQEEASQGITVQVSYSAFAWEGSSFLMADVPGHEEYTHNMAFAAAYADTAVIMAAANKGIVPQTRRHTRICHFMGIRNMIFAVNKMDMVQFKEEVFLQLSGEIRQMMEEYCDCTFWIVPVAAKSGANIAEAAKEMEWYQGGTLLFTLKQAVRRQEEKEGDFCMPVQRICKSSQMKGAVVKKRVIQGEIISGSISEGDEVFVYPTERRARVEGIYILNEKVNAAQKGSPVGIEMDRELDVARGYILTKADRLVLTDHIEADVLWTSDNRLTQGRRYQAQIGTASYPAAVTKICYQKDVNTGEHSYAEYLTKNALARCEICFPRQAPAACERENRILGTILLFERESHSLAAYGNIVHTVSEETWKENRKDVTAKEREEALGQKAGLLLFTKERRAKEYMNYAERYLLRMGFHTMQAVFEKTEEKSLSYVQRLLDAGLIVLFSSDEAERKEAERLLDGPERIFDCTSLPRQEEDLGVVLKQVKRWASELIS